MTERSEPFSAKPFETEPSEPFDAEPAVTWLAGPSGRGLVEPRRPARTGRPLTAGLVALVLLACFGAARLARPAAPKHAPAPQAIRSQAASQAASAAPSSLAPANAQWPVSANQVVLSCTEQQIEGLVHSFVSAVDRGDQAALTTLIAGAGQGFMSYTADRTIARPALLGYLAARHARHELITLTSLDFFEYSGIVVSFRFALSRQADDLAPRRESGTGAAYCNADRSPSIADWVVTGVS